MELITLATTALTLAAPFIAKTGEGVAGKVGEDIWTLIKAPFQRKGKNLDEKSFTQDYDQIRLELIEELKRDTDFKIRLQESVDSAQMSLNGSFQQNINNYDKIEKQINIQSNSGNIQM